MDDVIQRNPAQRRAALEEKMDEAAELTFLQLERAKTVLHRASFTSQDSTLLAAVLQALVANMASK